MRLSRALEQQARELASLHTAMSKNGEAHVLDSAVTLGFGLANPCKSWANFDAEQRAGTYDECIHEREMPDCTADTSVLYTKRVCVRHCAGAANVEKGQFQTYQLRRAAA